MCDANNYGGVNCSTCSDGNCATCPEGSFLMNITVQGKEMIVCERCDQFNECGECSDFVGCTTCKEGTYLIDFIPDKAT